VQDCSAATENLLLAAHAKGLGAMWLGIYPRENRVQGRKRLLDIPDGIIPFSLVPLGHPAEEKPKEDRFNIDRIHLERW
jgi:nitroreductase